jgi:hypothetical protein
MMMMMMMMMITMMMMMMMMMMQELVCSTESMSYTLPQLAVVKVYRTLTPARASAPDHPSDTPHRRWGWHLL